MEDCPSSGDTLLLVNTPARGRDWEGEEGERSGERVYTHTHRFTSTASVVCRTSPCTLHMQEQPHEQDGEGLHDSLNPLQNKAEIHVPNGTAMEIMFDNRY